MDQVVSDFIVQTTFTNFKPNINKLEVVYRKLQRECLTVSGSISELYIEPLLPCIGDLDVTAVDVDRIAVQSESQLLHEIKLPSIYKSIVKVYTIVDTEYPAYVGLVKIGELHKQPDSHNYAFVTRGVTDIGYVSWWSTSDNALVRGPARIQSEQSKTFNRILSQELVNVTHCLSWPRQADNWPTRNRKYNWPESTTVDLIVDKGCDLVPVEHHQFRKTGNQGTQERLSFSRAETVLLNNWTPIQQIVYHILRHLLDAEKVTDIRDSSECRILSRYNVKTLMLWFCELKIRIWWNRYNVVVLSCKVLQQLVECCDNGFCRGYFVTNHNLFECDVKSVELREVTERLSKLTNINYCTTLLVDKYVKVCAERCTPEIQRLLHKSVNTVSDLQILTSAIIVYRRTNASFDRLERYCQAQRYITQIIAELPAGCKNKQLVNVSKFLIVDEGLFYFAVASALLVVSVDLSEISLADNADLLFHLLNYRWTNNGSSSKPTLSYAAELTVSWKQVLCSLQSLALSGREVLDLQVILSQYYLNRVRMFSKRVRKRCVARVYLVAVYCKAGQYNKAAELLRTLTSYPRCMSVVVEGQLLPSFDKNVDNVLGILVLHQHVQTKALGDRLHAAKPLCSVFRVRVSSVQPFGPFKMN